jgi:hypothetical protein
MAEITQVNIQDFNTQIYESQESSLINSFEIGTTFNSQSYIEYFVYDLNKNLFLTEYNFREYTLNNLQNNPDELYEIIIDPSQSLLNSGFDQGTYISYYNFLDKKIGSNLEQLYISEISNDRTEIRLDSIILDELSLIEQTNTFIQERQDSDYFLDFYLNFGDNNLLIANNIILESQDITNPTILLKLYEPLPDEFNLNSKCWIVITIEESVAYQVTFDDPIFEINDTTSIQGPNFNLNIKDQVNNSTAELSYIDLITTSLTSSQQQLASLLEEKEIDVNIDYTTFEGYTHFSSAETRLRNFYYKIQVIEQYSSSISILNNTSNSDISGSISIYQSKIDNIITNFDGYDYFLYYESSSIAWPKTTTQKPYELAKSDSTAVLSWIGSTNESSPYYGGLLLSASLYDNENKDNLLYSIPEYLRDDSDNYQYELFVQMVAQHYDNIWVYHKEITKKYDNDNRLEYGVSKDIVADAIRDFGVKLYQNNFSNNDLYTAFLGLTPQGGLFPFPNITGSLPTPSGFEYIDQFISASNDFTPLDDVNKSLYKRIYHNLPYLLKSKGTLPGLRALITSYGIPDTILRINEFGGKDKVDSNDWDYWQNEFNYAFTTPANNFISSDWNVNPNWNTSDGVPDSVSFRFKTTGLPQNNIPYSQSLWNLDNDRAFLTLKYTGSGYTSSSYSGSSIDPYYQYAYLELYPGYNNAPTLSASIYLPFFNGGWWSVMINRVPSVGVSSYSDFTLYAGNNVYEGGDNGTLLGFYSSSTITTVDDSDWLSNGVSNFALGGHTINGNLYDYFSGSLQEIRYFKSPLSESVFKDYIMNPHSIEGNNINSSPDELIFRASLGGELYTGSNSIHPKVTGSWVTTQSFTSDSNFYYDQTPVFTPNTEYFFYDQPIAGIRNSISDKIRIENNVMPEGDTLSPFMSLSQMSNVSQSYTQNINYLEVAFSPTNEINEDIMSQIGSFNIGEYIGDPRLRSSSAVTYPALDQLRNEYFQKYISNYNLTDFIRLIKFFDNSLFKMIRDFVPARTSLASGIVIKQHLLERNKYPQPQIELENLDISGTLKPTWNNYEPGTVENFEGQTGGVFDQFNLISNTSQSWYENITTPSGSVLMLHDSQDEFYNGEFSGSIILVTDGILNEAFSSENLEFEYKQVHYYGTSSNSSFASSSIENLIFENNFLNNVTSPQDGEILFYNEMVFVTIKIVNTFVTVWTGNWKTKYLKIAKTDCNGNNNAVALGQINKILIYIPSYNLYIPYNLTILNEQSNYYLYQLNTVQSYSPSLWPNQVFDYTVSASNASSFIPSSTTIATTFTLYGSTSGNALGYFDSNTGIHTLSNTPNTQISLTGSVSISGTGTGRFRIDLLRQGNVTSIQSINISAGSPYSISSSYYGLQGDQIYLSAVRGTGSPQFNNGSLLITQSRAVSASSCEPVILEPYITTPNFYNSDGNALLNNAFELRDSSYYMDVDYSSGLTEPVNFGQLISGSATRAKVQDSNYTSKRVTIPRYEGSKSTSRQLNKWTRGDIGTFGKLPTVENLKSYVAYGYMDGSWAPERMNASAFTIKYLIDQDGNISTPNISDISLSNTQQNFPSGDRFRYSSILGLSGTQGGTTNQFRNIIRGGYRIEPILYTQSGSAPGAQWNTTMSFEDIVPSDQGAVGNYSALYGLTSNPQFVENDLVKVPYDNVIYGSSISNNGYEIPLGVLQDGVNLVVNAEVTLKLENFNLTPKAFNLIIYIYKNNTEIASVASSVEVPSAVAGVGGSVGTLITNIDINSVIFLTSEIEQGDEIFVYVKVDPFTPMSNYFYIYNTSTKLKISQYPLFTQPVTSSGINSIWGYADSGSYPYVITSSNQTLVELYDSNVKQTDIIGSGFNPIALPWSIQYGDEFRFEGREDFTYVVGKIFSSADSGSGRIFQTGSIEVHFDRNLPISASSSAFNLDHFLIRRYVDDPSQIIFEGFRPTNGSSPNSFILTPEYVIPKLNKNTDEFVKLLTEKGLIG